MGLTRKHATIVPVGVGSREKKHSSQPFPCRIYIYIYPSPTPTGGVLASQSCMATPSSQTWLKIFISIYHPHVVGCRLGLKTSKTISSGLSLHGHYTLGEKLVHYNCRWLQLVHYNRPLQLTAREYTHMNDFGGYSRTYLNWYCLIQ